MIEFTNVSKTYTKQIGSVSHAALSNISFSMKNGETLGLIGANGAGKSTSIRLLMDFIRPDTGKIRISGQPPTSPTTRNQIGYLPEVAGFPTNLTILDMLKFTGIACGMKSAEYKERGRDLLETLKLWEARKKPLISYSKGMQQRASFSVALLNNPELLILDEPMSGLDPLGRNTITSLILDLKKRGKTILFCSHILEDVDRLVDNILVLHLGKRLFYGPPANLIDSTQKANLPDAYLSLVTEGTS